MRSFFAHPSPLLCASLLLAICPTSFAQTDDLHSLSHSLQQKTTQASKLWLHYQNQINLFNPQLAAVSALNPAVMQEIEQAERHTNAVSALHGIPILVKDNIAVQGMATTAGSLALANNIARQDAFIVQKLRAAGMVIAGKTNLSEWANFRSTKSSSGWSSAGGQTRNPYDPKRSPCGSSSGSGAAVAARMIPAAIGTETDGSIVCPAAINGLVGFKPTLGMVSRSGILPLSHSQDTAGPMTLTVRDAAMLMNVISGTDPADTATQEADKRRAADFTSGLHTHALKGKRLGVIQPLLAGYDTATMALFRRSLAILRAQGATLIEGLPFRQLERMGKDEYTVLLSDFKHDLNQYLAQAPAQVTVRNLEQVIAYNHAHAPQVMPHFGQEIMLMAQASPSLDDANYLRARQSAKTIAGRQGIDQLMQRYRLDALIAPTTGPAWRIDYPKGDLVTGSASSPAAVAGYPHITVPMGLVRGLPVGLSMFAGAWQDAQLLNMAYAFEQARPALPKPQLKPAQASQSP